MLLQGAGGRLRVFPALPSAWRDTSFRDLRAEGGFVVSAEQRDGQLRRVAIRATVEQELRLADPFTGRPCDHNLPITRVAGEIRCRLRAGQTLELSGRAVD
jgi:alpha-L-fucosidase 2